MDNEFTRLYSIKSLLIHLLVSLSQGYHWNNKQATVHPFVIHWWNAAKKSVEYRTFCVISDELSHDTDTFHAFRVAFIQALKADPDLQHITKIYYVSDGAAAHYKNFKNFANLMQHKHDFDIDAEWHFTATSHGKSTCDAMSAVVKCATRRGSIVHKKIITTPIDMFNYCRDTQTTETRKFIFVTKQDVSSLRDGLAARYQEFIKIPSTRKQHVFRPQQDGTLSVGRLSDSSQCQVFNVQNIPPTTFNFNIVEPGFFYAFNETNTYQIGMLVESNQEEDYVQMQKFKINKVTRVVSWPEAPVFTEVCYADIFSRVRDPVISSENKYVIGPEEMDKIRKAYVEFQKTFVQVS